MVDDRELIDHWRKGRADAARTIVDRHYPRMLNLFYRLTDSRDQAEELTQDLFVRLTRHIAGHGEVDNLAAWLHRVGHNLWRDWVRRVVTARKKGITSEGGDEELLRLNSSDEVEAQAVSHWEQDAVRRAVLELSPSHREVVVLFYYQGLSYQEIAEMADVPVGTVRSRLHYAVRQLRSRLSLEAEGGSGNG